MQLSDFRRLARSRLDFFAQAVFPGYVVGVPQRKIITALMCLERGIFDRLFISLPPRHGKSLLTSEIFPAWFLGRNPDSQIILTSYSGGLAKTFKARVRDNMHSKAFQFAFGGPGGVTLNPRRPVQIDLMGYRGDLHATGVGGGITGRGADLLIIDDPVKDSLEAMSETYRERTYDWYTSTAYTRLMPGGRIVIIMTRWHEADLAGKIKESLQLPGSESWVDLHLPAIDEMGNALWPERFPLEVLLRIKNAVGLRVWESLYQGRPAPPEGTLIKRSWFHVVQAPPRFEGLRRVRFWDFGGQEGKGDYTAGVLIAHYNGVFYIEHVVRGQWELAGRNVVVRQTAERDKALYGPGNVRIMFEREGGSSGLDTRSTVYDYLSGFPINSEKPYRNKVTRLEPFRAQAEVGNVRIVAGPWIGDYLDELAVFPYGAHDDQVDATSGAFNALTSGLSNFEDYLMSRYGTYDPDLIIVRAEEPVTPDDVVAELSAAPDVAPLAEAYREEIAAIPQYHILLRVLRPTPLDLFLRQTLDLSLERVDDENFLVYHGLYVVRVTQHPERVINVLERQGIAEIADVVLGALPIPAEYTLADGDEEE